MPPPHDGCHHNPNEDDVSSPTSPLNFLDQNYQELHQNCLAENTLYNDELFPPDNSSIGLFDDESLEVDLSQVVWKRPSVCKLYRILFINILYLLYNGFHSFARNYNKSLNFICLCSGIERTALNYLSSGTGFRP